jgi:ABC-type transport system substrate-binding protein
MHRYLVLLTVLLLTSACVAPASSPSSSSGAPSQPGTERSAPGAPKQLTIGILQEPKAWSPWQEATSAGGAGQMPNLVRRTLTHIDKEGIAHAEFATGVPSLERGDWQVNADGTMRQTWTLRPGLKWHDGEALTADDFLFSYELQTAPGAPKSISAGFNLISGVSAPDDQTVIMTFKGASPLAGQALFDPYPRHLIGDLIATNDPDRMMNSDFWSTGYVGNGPYRLTAWQPGASQTFAAFPEFYRGKPKVDTLIVKFLTDNNTLLANLLSGGVDVALPDGLSIETAAELKNGWAAPGTGNNVAIYADGRHYYMEFQHRPEFAKPLAGRDPRVRAAFYRTIDKEGINQVETAGLGLLADSWLPPDDPRRPQFRDAIPEWSYDTSLAQRILEDAGWRRGADGILVNNATGERMETEIRVTNTTGHVKAMAVLAAGWEKVGAAVSQVTIPAAQASVQEYRSSFSFAGLSGYGVAYYGWENYRYGCTTASRLETRWLGHRDGYCNPAIQPLIERLDVTIPDAERIPLQALIMRALLKDDFAGPPIYWQVSPVVFNKNVTGPGPVKIGAFDAAKASWNVEDWDKVS